MEQGIHAPPGPTGPPLDARGTSFPGTNLYVQLGRGRDYAWSATSAGQDIIDTFAVPLCEPDGSEPTLDSMHYRFRGECLEIEVLERTNSWAPTPADQTPPGSETLRAERTALGIVTARAMVGGRAHAYTRLRATYFHEVDSAAGFADFNNPQAVRSASDFMRAASKIDYTFNWFYADGRDIAYFNSGANPRRAANVDPNFPTRGTRRFEWHGYNPLPELTYERLPPARRPQVTNQEWMTSWNNKQARGYRAADDNYAYGSVFRSTRLDRRLRSRLRGNRKIGLPQLADAMQDAATVDLRGERLLPVMLRALRPRTIRSPRLRRAVATLRAWRRAGSHRRDSNGDGTYDHAEAVRIMDAWWPHLVTSQFRPRLGKALFEEIQGMIGLHDAPGPVGSAFISGWYGYVDKDLRRILGRPVKGRFSQAYCGGGRLALCRKRLRRSLGRALRNRSDAQLYPGQPDSACEGIGDAQWCNDAVRHSAVGVITQPPIHWTDRPTFQQAVEVQGSRP